MSTQPTLGIATSVSVFNGYVASMVAFALEEIGFFKLLARQTSVSLEGAAEALRVQSSILEAMCQSLVAIDILTSNATEGYGLTAEGRLFAEQLGFFTWAIGGYGAILRSLPQLASGEYVFGQDVVRNDRYVAEGAGKNIDVYVFPLVSTVLSWHTVRTLVDIGCGSAELLIRFCQLYPHLTCIGVDISPKACEAAQRNVNEAGLNGQITIIQADVCTLLASKDKRVIELLQRADIVTCFFMLHDLIHDMVQASDLLLRFKKTFPHASRFLIGDTVKPSSSIPLKQTFFILAFELVHALMGQRTWEKEFYESLFTSVGLNIERFIEFPVPSTWLYVLRP